MEVSSDLIALGLLVVGGFVAIGLIRWLLSGVRAAPVDRLQNAILVDGSNVMHWGGDPSEKVLRHVIDRLKEQGLEPIVIFDANVGYKLQDRFLDEAQMARLMGVPRKQVVVVNKGQTADELILDQAAATDWRIVTNDRFRDWAVRYKFVKQHKRFVRGEWRGGNVLFRGL